MEVGERNERINAGTIRVPTGLIWENAARRDWLGIWRHRTCAAVRDRSAEWVIHARHGSAIHSSTRRKRGRGNPSTLTVQNAAWL